MSLRVASINVNGIRAAMRKGFGAWLARHEPDVLLLQETRAPELTTATLLGAQWTVHEAVAEHGGRAGVAIATKSEALDVSLSIGGPQFVGAGRWIEVTNRLADGVTVCFASCYVHTGEASDPDRMKEKYAFLDAIEHRLDALERQYDYVVVGGDFNVARAEIDIKNWKGNRGKAGFLEQERAYFDRWEGQGWVDLGRQFGGPGPGPYTWWSYRGRAYDNDAGWRIDYLLASSRLGSRAKDVFVERSASYEDRWSDHAPVVAVFD